MKGDLLIRHHLRPRIELFVPDESIMPFPLKYVDVTRKTRTTLESPSEKSSKIIGACLIASLLGATLSQRIEACLIIGQDKLRSFFFVILHHQDKNGYLEDWSRNKNLSDHRQFGQRYGARYLRSKKNEPESNGSRRNPNSKKLRRHEDSNIYQQKMRSSSKS